MSTPRVGTIAALIAGLALSASPALAQDRSEAQPRGGRRNPDAARSGGDNGGARNRGGNRNGDQAERGNRGGDQAQRSDGGNRGGERTEPADRSAAPRAEAVPRERYENRDNDNRDRDRGRYDNRDRDRDRDRPVAVPRYRDNRDYRYQPRYAPRYYSRPNRVYVVPYGYRPQGYRRDWSLNLYFGRPYGGYYNRGYGSPAYGGGYGYYAIQPGFAYGSLRIVDAPRDAEVFVDGYYAGIVDDYDGVFQHLNLEPGTHHVEIDVYPGQAPLEFDVNVAPGQTVTFHARY